MSLAKVIGGWVNSERLRGVQRYSVGHISSVERVQKRGQDNIVVKVVNTF